LLESPEVDVLFILTLDEYHELYAVGALNAGKHVMIEKPITLSRPSAQRILAAEQSAPNGAKVFVGYMRRYARSFTQTFKREISNIPRILYARSRDFSGPNAKFVSESGTFPVRNTDFPAGAGEERDRRLNALISEAFNAHGPVTPEHVKFCRFLGSLGSHDLSLLRETLGFPESVGGVSANEPFYSAILHYRNSTGEPFAVTYESGIDGVPEFDAHLAVYGEKKRVTIQYPSPYVKGLPIKVIVNEVNENGEIEIREILGSYEDAYTAELKEMYECLVHGKPIKTSAKDALQDLELFDMFYTEWRRRPGGTDDKGQGQKAAAVNGGKA
jgi:predicted dehydrogenase